jgi:hypothetical protein
MARLKIDPASCWQAHDSGSGPVAAGLGMPQILELIHASFPGNPLAAFEYFPELPKRDFAARLSQTIRVILRHHGGDL